MLRFHISVLPFPLKGQVETHKTKVDISNQGINGLASNLTICDS
jgi:hypothetical protein